MGPMTRGSQLLQEALAKQGLSQRKAGQSLGFAEGVITRLCKGDRGPRVETAAKIEAMFGVPMKAWSEPAIEPDPASPTPPTSTGTDG